VVLPKAFLDQLDLGETGEVELTLEQNRIVIAPHRYAADAEFKQSAKRMLKKHGKSLERLSK
jgi:antitoxin component of MazEF toxin-antitoxin module